jgi:capsule polysaccharide export protein KpsE/RkpR
MKTIIAIIFVVSQSLLGFANTHKKTDTLCNFLKHLKFKNGIDTIKIKVKYQSQFESPDYSILKKLNDEKILDYNEFGVESNGTESSSAISFTLENFLKIFDATTSKKVNRDLVNSLKPGQFIYLTCVVFDKDVGKHFYPDSKFEPYFVIIDIEK